MKKGTFIALSLVFTFMISCADSQLVEQWRNPEIESFTAQKVLVLAVSNDQENVKIFEDRLVKQLQEKGINAYNSTVFFKDGVPEEPVDEKEKQTIEKELLLAGYDAVLVSKVIGAQDKSVLIEKRLDIARSYDSFGADYYSSQDLYCQKDRLENYTVYHAQSVLYCVCPDRTNKTIWRASIDVNKLDTEKKAIKDYIKMLIRTLEDQDILIVE